jgi:hypothetical protein
VPEYETKSIFFRFLHSRSKFQIRLAITESNLYLSNTGNPFSLFAVDFSFPIPPDDFSQNRI